VPQPAAHAQPSGDVRRHVQGQPAAQADGRDDRQRTRDVYGRPAAPTPMGTILAAGIAGYAVAVLLGS
jgi:hypothetical protein